MATYLKALQHGETSATVALVSAYPLLTQVFLVLGFVQPLSLPALVGTFMVIAGLGGSPRRLWVAWSNRRSSAVVLIVAGAAVLQL